MEDSKIMQAHGISRTLVITQAAIIVALYTVLTLIANLFGLASGVIQVRISEALTVLPFLSFIGIPGVTIGCLISNIVTGADIFDIIFGTFPYSTNCCKYDNSSSCTDLCLPRT